MDDLEDLQENKNCGDLHDNQFERLEFLNVSFIIIPIIIVELMLNTVVYCLMDKTKFCFSV